MFVVNSIDGSIAAAIAVEVANSISSSSNNTSNSKYRSSWSISSMNGIHTATAVEVARSSRFGGSNSIIVGGSAPTYR